MLSIIGLCILYVAISAWFQSSLIGAVIMFFISLIYLGYFLIKFAKVQPKNEKYSIIKDDIVNDYADFIDITIDDENKPF